jgi:hypothetical protein
MIVVLSLVFPIIGFVIILGIINLFSGGVLVCPLGCVLTSMQGDCDCI